jgi:hypothetical protein
LKGLSQTEAELITKLAPFVMEGRVFRDASHYLEQKGIDLTFMIDMQELGIATGVEGIGLSTHWETVSKDVAFRRVFRCYRKALIVEHKELKELHTSIYILTRVERELLGLGTFEPDIEYMRLVGLSIAMKGFTVRFADWKQESERMGRCFNAVEIKTEAPPAV